MAKKDKSPPLSAPLKHSPFAALRGPVASLEPAAREKPLPPVLEPRASSEAQAQASAREDRAAALPASAATPAGPGKSRGRLVQRRETKHRAGKAVIVVTGFEALQGFDQAAVAALAKELKQALGCGGTVESRAGAQEIVLQGDRPAQVAELLRARGFRVDGVTR